MNSLAFKPHTIGLKFHTPDGAYSTISVQCDFPVTYTLEAILPLAGYKDRWNPPGDNEPYSVDLTPLQKEQDLKLSSGLVYSLISLLHSSLVEISRGNKPQAAHMTQILGGQCAKCDMTQLYMVCNYLSPEISVTLMDSMFYTIEQTLKNIPFTNTYLFIIQLVAHLFPKTEIKPILCDCWEVCKIYHIERLKSLVANHVKVTPEDDYLLVHLISVTNRANAAEFVECTKGHIIDILDVGDSPVQEALTILMEDVGNLMLLSHHKAEFQRAWISPNLTPYGAMQRADSNLTKRGGLESLLVSLVPPTQMLRPLWFDTQNIANSDDTNGQITQINAPDGDQMSDDVFDLIAQSS